MSSILSKPALRRGLVAVVVLCLGTAPAGATTSGDSTGQVSVGGTVRTYALHVPDASPPRDGFPVVLAFHGGGGRGVRMRRLSGLDALADNRGFVVAYPDGIDGHWNDGRSTIRNPQDDVGFTAALLDRIAATLPVDRGRIYATGLSNGALFTHRLACDRSSRIAAIAPVAGTLPADLAARCTPNRPVAVLQVSGTADPIMPFEGGRVADFGGRGEGGQVLSVAETAASWARRNGCGDPGVEEALPTGGRSDPTRILRTRYTRCPAGGAVTVVKVVEGGHTWPGGPQFAPAFLVGAVSRQLDASRTLVDFFLSLPPRR